MSDSFRPDKWLGFFWGYWWLRGAVVAISAMAIFTGLIGENAWVPWEAAKEVVSTWNVVAQRIGAALGYIPFVPALDAIELNTILLTIGLVIPSMVCLLVWMRVLDCIRDLIKTDLRGVENGAVLILRIFSADRIRSYLKLSFALATAALPIGFYGVLMEWDRLDSESVALRAIFATLFVLYISWSVFLISRLYPEFVKAIVIVFVTLVVLEVLFIMSFSWPKDQLAALRCWLEPNVCAESAAPEADTIDNEAGR